MRSKRNIVISVLPDHFDSVSSSLLELGIPTQRNLADLGVITAEVDETEVASIRSIAGVQDIEWDLSQPPEELLP